MKVILKNVRLSFPNLFRPETVQGDGEPAYSANFLLDPKGGILVNTLEAAIVEAAQEKWGAKAAANLKTLRATDKVCLHDGDAKTSYDGYEGMLFVSARNKLRPLVLDSDKSPLTEEDGRPYAGCFVNASLEIWAQDNKYGKRINAGLLGVQFFRDGDSFSGASVASDADFDDVSAEDLV